MGILELVKFVELVSLWWWCLNAYLVFCFGPKLFPQDWSFGFGPSWAKPPLAPSFFFFFFFLNFKSFLRVLKLWIRVLCSCRGGLKVTLQTCGWPWSKDPHHRERKLYHVHWVLICSVLVLAVFTGNVTLSWVICLWRFRCYRELIVYEKLKKYNFCLP
jgi:hypothetical protein